DLAGPAAAPRRRRGRAGAGSGLEHDLRERIPCLALAALALPLAVLGTAFAADIGDAGFAGRLGHGIRMTAEREANVIAGSLRWRDATGPHRPAPARPGPRCSAGR